MSSKCLATLILSFLLLRRFTANKKGPSLPTVCTVGPFDDDSVINYDNAAAASVGHDLFAVGWLI